MRGEFQILLVFMFDRIGRIDDEMQSEIFLHLQIIDPHTFETAHKLDGIINEVVRGLFEQLNDVPKDAVIAERYASKIASF